MYRSCTWRANIVQSHKYEIIPYFVLYVFKTAVRLFILKIRYDFGQ